MKGEFEFIYKENYLILYKYLIKIGCPPEDAQDVIQETFIKAIQNIHVFNFECALSSWLCQIARNTWYSELRKRKHHVFLADESIVSDYDYEHSLSFLDYIEEPYKSVFTLKSVMGYEYHEIAERYGKSESWARVTYYRARLKYQKLFEEDEK